MGLRGTVGALLLIFAFCGNTRAATSGGDWYDLTHFSCADLVGRYSVEVAARNANRSGAIDRILNSDFAVIKLFISGWLSAYNMLAPDTYNIVPSGLDGAVLWLNNYCTKNPLATLDTGLAALVIEAQPSRQQKPPGQ